ncbi:MAG TPA: four helix bundle protein [Phycisphaerae bacterium]|nr:four helix bundle protein [Phycisphaerae bacterium]
MTGQRDRSKYGASPFGFEDLDAYKEARQLRRAIYRLAKTLPPEEKYALAQQMRRASVSLTNNIAEGYGRFHWQESLQFVRHSRGSLMELVDDLNVCEDENYASQETLLPLRNQAETVLRLVNGYGAYLERMKAES